jgi:hypothetical protein
MSLNSWITSLVGLMILILTIWFIVPLVYFINTQMIILGAPASIAGKLMNMMEWGFYVLGFGLMILPVIIDNWKREETGMEY